MDTHFGAIIFQTHPAELARRLRYPQWPLCVVDVRSAAAFARGHVAGAISMPGGDLTALPDGSGPLTEFILVGAGPGDAATRRASLALQRLGAQRVVELSEGMRGWLLERLPVEGVRARAA